jgi:hypothetical protein
VGSGTVMNIESPKIYDSHVESPLDHNTVDSPNVKDIQFESIAADIVEYPRSDHD